MTARHLALLAALCCTTSIHLQDRRALAEEPQCGIPDEFEPITILDVQLVGVNNGVACETATVTVVVEVLDEDRCFREGQWHVVEDGTSVTITVLGPDGQPIDTPQTSPGPIASYSFEGLTIPTSSK